LRQKAILFTTYLYCKISESKSEIYLVHQYWCSSSQHKTIINSSELNNEQNNLLIGVQTEMSFSQPEPSTFTIILWHSKVPIWWSQDWELTSFFSFYKIPKDLGLISMK
jgi:hypothetical protein